MYLYRGLAVWCRWFLSGSDIGNKKVIYIRHIDAYYIDFVSSNNILWSSNFEHTDCVPSVEYKLHNRCFLGLGNPAIVSPAHMSQISTHYQGIRAIASSDVECSDKNLFKFNDD